MKTKNSLSLFEEAVSFYQLSQVLSRPDKELLHAAFYFALHRFMSGEEFPLERLYEVSPELLFEQFYLYYRKHSCCEAFDLRVLRDESDAAKVMKAVVYCLEKENNGRRIACQVVLQKAADSSYLNFLGKMSKGYPQILGLMADILNSKKSVEAIYLTDLLVAYNSREADGTQEFEVIYLWLERLADPIATAKYLLIAAKGINKGSTFTEFHASHLMALLRSIAEKDDKNQILPGTVLSLVMLTNIALKIRLDILRKYIISVYKYQRGEFHNHFETALSALLNESYMQYSDECYDILSKLQIHETTKEISLTVLGWAEQAWRGYYLLQDPEGSDFYEDNLWRFAETVLQGKADDRQRDWLVICCELALNSESNVWCYEPLPLWLALQICRNQEADRFTKEHFLPIAKNIIDLQCCELERFLEERENQIEWEKWQPALDYFWSDKTSEAIIKVLQIVAYYADEDMAAMKAWTEEHGIRLTGWGSCLEKNKQREALMAALKVD